MTPTLTSVSPASTKVFHRQLQHDLPVAVAGQGITLTDANGKTYLDACGGAAVSCLGHGHPEVLAAMHAQIDKLAYAHTSFLTTDVVEELADVLIESAPKGMSHVYFVSGGSEAMEAALKMARQYFVERGEPQRQHFVARKQSYHGNTLGVLAVGGNAWRRAPFAPLLDGVAFLPFGDVAALEAAFGDDVAGIVLEPVQGEVGVREQPEGYLRRARELCDAHDALLVLDEVQSGIGRTGTWLAHHHPDLGGGVVPDVVTLAKGLGGGIPIGAALLLTDRATALIEPGSHGTTFGGNPVAAAAALAVLDTIESAGLLENTARIGKELATGILDVAGDRVTRVRGRGLLLGLALREPNAPAVYDALLARGVIANACTPQTIRLAPPLTLGHEQVTEFLAALPGALDDAVGRSGGAS